MKNTSNLTRPLVPAMLAFALLAACGKHEPPAAVPAAGTGTAAAAPAKKAFVSTVPHTSTVDVTVGGADTQQATTLSDGATAGGQVVSTAAGKVVGVSVFVGNYFDSATGAFDVEACVADRCQRGTVDAATSIDNEMLEIPLAAPLDVAAGDTVTYTFSRAAGTNPIAIWTYAAVSPTDHLSAPNDVARTPKISLLLN